MVPSRDHCWTSDVIVWIAATWQGRRVVDRPGGRSVICSEWDFAKSAEAEWLLQNCSGKWQADGRSGEDETSRSPFSVMFELEPDADAFRRFVGIQSTDAKAG